MQKILITGANGQLGNELMRLHWGEKFVLYPTDLPSLDLQEEDAIQELVSSLRPDYIINAAAYTNVEKAEDDRETALAINATAVRYLAQAAKKWGAKIIHISTDYVFQGNESSPYTESEIPHPINVYGETKLLGEKELEEAGCPHIILRTAWLYSSFGKNFVKTMRTLFSQRDELRVVNDQRGTPTYAKDLALAIHSILHNGWHKEKEGIYHFTNLGEASWYDFAKEIHRLSSLGDTCHLLPTTSLDYPQKAVRPTYSVLSKDKIQQQFHLVIRPWQTALKECIDELNQQ